MKFQIKLLLLAFLLVNLFACKKGRIITQLNPVDSLGYDEDFGLGYAQDISIMKNKLFYSGGKKISCYDLKTKKLDFHFDKQGNGPGEIRHIKALSLINENSFYAFDFSLKRLNIFDLKGNFIKAQKAEKGFKIAFNKYTNKHYLCPLRLASNANIFEIKEDKFSSVFNLEKCFTVEDGKPKFSLYSLDFTKNGFTVCNFFEKRMFKYDFEGNVTEIKLENNPIAVFNSGKYVEYGEHYNYKNGFVMAQRCYDENDPEATIYTALVYYDMNGKLLKAYELPEKEAYFTWDWAIYEDKAYLAASESEIIYEFEL